MCIVNPVRPPRLLLKPRAGLAHRFELGIMLLTAVPMRLAGDEALLARFQFLTGPAFPATTAVWRISQTTDRCLPNAVQAHANAHAQAQAEAEVQAQSLAVQAQAHATAQAQAEQAASRLKKVASMNASQFAGACGTLGSTICWKDLAQTDMGDPHAPPGGHNLPPLLCCDQLVHFTGAEVLHAVIIGW